MQIGSSISSIQAKPSAPSAPTPPPGGNIENRRPPSEPSAPNLGASGTSSMQPNDPLSQFVNELDSEYGTNIKSSLDSLSDEGKEYLRTRLEEFRATSQSMGQEGREKGFLEIMTQVFREFGGDYQTTGNLLSAYA